MTDPAQHLRQMLAERPLTVQVEQRLEHRIRLYADRLNRRLAAQGDTDPYRVDDDHELAHVIMFLAETKLDEDEHADDLTSDHATGQLIPREQADKRERRRHDPQP
jgi:hypothetical protein